MSDLSSQFIQHIDHYHIWHPYTSTPASIPPYIVIDAQGVLLTLADGRKVIDGMSSWWCVIHGYKHPTLNAALTAQVSRFAHVMFGGLTHEPATRLTATLLDVIPKGLERVFFCDSGSVSVEVAMKMALQYQHARGAHKRIRFATILGGYHGDTWHPMSVCDPHTGMHTLYQGRLSTQYFLPRPQSRFTDSVLLDEDRMALDRFFHKHGNEVAAFIIEPIVQGAGGMWFYHPDYLRHLTALCCQYEVLLIADEIATGFGRTGQWFGVNHAAVVPDIMCIGKALTGGYLSFAATLCRAEVADVISHNAPGVFMHGPTFMGNPLACAVANASLELLQSGNWHRQVEHIERQLHTMLMPLKAQSYVADVRVLGAIGVVELVEPVDIGTITPMFVEAGVWIRPFGKLVYLMPPFVITDAELVQLIEAVIAVLKAYALRTQHKA